MNAAIDENLQQCILEHTEEQARRREEMWLETKLLEQFRGENLNPQPLTPEWIAYYQKIGLLPVTKKEHV